MTLVKLTNVTKSYIKVKYDLEIKVNDKLLIIGNNGIGKTTLVKLICGYIKSYEGEIVRNTNNISYLEEALALPYNMNVGKYINVMEDIKGHNINYELGQIFNIPKNKTIRQLSKGNKQKLALLISLIKGNDLYILDEPLNGLDSKTSGLFLEFLKNFDATLLIISHSPNNFKSVTKAIYEL